MTGPRLTGNRCQCPTCGEYFASARGFDRHRIGPYAKPGEWQGTRRCLTLAELQARGWERNPRGFLLTPDPRRAGVGVVEGAREARPLPTQRVT